MPEELTETELKMKHAISGMLIATAGNDISGKEIGLFLLEHKDNVGFWKNVLTNFPNINDASLHVLTVHYAFLLQQRKGANQ